MGSIRLRLLPAVLVLAVVAGACSRPIDDPAYWQSDEFLETMPRDVVLAYPLHVRTAVVQEYGAGTWVDDLTDHELVTLIQPWCDEGAGGRTDAVRQALEDAGHDNNPGRNFLPPLPIDEIMVAIADRYQPELCDASGG
jgi:hypothetical protein